MIRCGRPRSCLGPAMGGKVATGTADPSEWQGCLGADCASERGRPWTSADCRLRVSSPVTADHTRGQRLPLVSGVDDGRDRQDSAHTSAPLRFDVAACACRPAAARRTCRCGDRRDLGAAGHACAGPTSPSAPTSARPRGGNLFHSFQRFNVDTGGRVTFTGPDGAANVIGRVTGGERSSIDGTLASDDPGRRPLPAQPRRHPVRPERAAGREGLVPRQHRRRAAASPTGRCSARWTRPAARSAWPSRRRSGSWAPMSGGSRSTGSTLLVPPARRSSLTAGDVAHHRRHAEHPGGPVRAGHEQR